MLKPCDSLSIHVNVPFGTATLNVVGSSNNAVLGVNDEAPNGVSAYQLQEGATYQYEFVSDNGHLYQFEKENEIIRFSTFCNHIYSNVSFPHINKIDIFFSNFK